MTNYFTIDGKSSSEYGLFVKKLPLIPVALENIDYYNVSGRNETLSKKTNKYPDIKITLEAVLLNFEADDIKRWISSGKKLVLSNQNDRFLIIKKIAEFKPDRIGNGAMALTITLECSPFKYPVENDFEIVSEYFKTQGNVYSQPVLMIEGITNNCVIELNSVKLTLTGLSGTVYVDADRKVIYKIENGEKAVVQNNTVGSFWDFVLIPSETDYNHLKFSGAASVRVQKNERWL